MTSYENLLLNDGVREILNGIAEIPKKSGHKAVHNLRDRD